MIEQRARAEWRGGLRDGSGRIESATLDEAYSFATRFEGAKGVTPEELIGAAHAGCFSMALSLILGERGYTPESIRTTATVRLDGDELEITGIELETEGNVPGLDEAEFKAIAQQASENCPVSKALGAVPIELRSATLSAPALEHA